VAVLGESVARRFWPGENPIGRRIKWGGPDNPVPWIEVVGIVEDSRARGLEQVTLDAYVPYEQSPWPLNHLVLRTRSDPAALVAALRREAASLVPSARLLDVATVGAMMRTALVRPRLATSLLSGFALVAVVLAGIGLAGVLWFTTRERTREIGIRMALGATSGRIRVEVLREGLLLAVSGLLLGLAGAGLFARALRSQLYEVGPYHLPTYALVAALLALVAVAACWIPAWRASREDAGVALRAE
jgi:putative ABC transport system permease protein